MAAKRPKPEDGPPPRDLSLEGIVARTIGDFVRPTVLIPFRMSILYKTHSKYTQLLLGTPFLAQSHWTEEQRYHEVKRRVIQRWGPAAYTKIYDPEFKREQMDRWNGVLGLFVPSGTKFYTWSYIREQHGSKFYWLPVGALVAEDIQ